MKILTSLCTLVSAIAALSSAVANDAVAPVPDDVRRDFHLAPFYQKYVSVEGLPIVSSDKPSDCALLETAWIIRHMLPGREDILHAIAAQHVRVAVMAWNEFTTDIPEHSTLSPARYWDRRARGLGATRQRPAISCAEENVLAFPSDSYGHENILIHEFSHTVHEIGLQTVSPSFDDRLQQAYEAAMKAGLWKDTYSTTNRKEYWAEGAQAWFDAASAQVTHGVNTRDKLKAYDPALAVLCAEVFGDHPWRYQKPWSRPAEEREHLTGFDPMKAPQFLWRQ